MELQLSAIVTNTLNHHIHFGCNKSGRQPNFGYLAVGQTKGFLTGGTVKMDVQVVMIIGITGIHTQGELGRTGTIIYAMDQPLVFKSFQGAVYGYPVGGLQAFLDIGQTHGRTLV